MSKIYFIFIGIGIQSTFTIGNKIRSAVAKYAFWFAYNDSNNKTALGQVIPVINPPNKFDPYAPNKEWAITLTRMTQKIQVQ